MAESALLSLFAEFLPHPVVEVRTAPSDEITRLRATLDAVQDENTRLSFQYSKEVQICLRYEDYLNSGRASPIWRVRLMVGRRVVSPEMNGSNPLPATIERGV